MIPVPIVHSAVRGDRRDPGVIGPDEPTATGVGSCRIAFIELTDVARRRLKAIS